MDPYRHLEPQPAALADRWRLVARGSRPEAPRGLPNPCPIRPCPRCGCHCLPGGQRTATPRPVSSLPRDYELHISGRYDSRYADIYNGFAVRKGRVRPGRARRDSRSALGLALRLSLSATVGRRPSCVGERDGRKLRLLNVHLKSKCFSKSLRNPRSRSCRTLARQAEPLEAWIDARWREGVRRSWCWEISTVKWTDTASATICGPPSRTATLRDSSSDRLSAGRDPGLLARDLASPPLPNRSLRVRRTRMDAGGRIILPTSRLDRCGCGPAPRPALRSLSDRRGSLVTIASSHLDPHNLQTSRETVIPGRCGMISTVGPTIHRTALPVRQGPSTGAVKYSDHPGNARRHQLNSDEH